MCTFAAVIENRFLLNLRASALRRRRIRFGLYPFRTIHPLSFGAQNDLAGGRDRYALRMSLVFCLADRTSIHKKFNHSYEEA